MADGGGRHVVKERGSEGSPSVRVMSSLFLMSSFLLVGCGARHRVPVLSDCEPFYAVALRPVPLLNTQDVHHVYGGRKGRRVLRDQVGLVRAVEVVALEGASFRVDGQARSRDAIMWRVTTPDYDYPSKTGYFVDSRFLARSEGPKARRNPGLPSPTVLRYRLLRSLGSTYVWGGNVAAGIPDQLRYYPPSRRISQDDRHHWSLKGVDCSGLLYEATRGLTPRNASSLIRYGRAVPIAGRSPEEIAASLRPFDVIGWRTHVMIALDPTELIQSRVDYDYEKPGNQGGVRRQDLVAYLHRLMESYDPVDDWDDEVPEGRNKFVIRRWYPWKEAK